MINLFLFIFSVYLILFNLLKLHISKCINLNGLN
jgi:hypothetical protein